MTECKISVIIPVKNGGATLERCLQSIRDQTIANSTEIIILNSMSTDNSLEIAGKFNARIIDIPEGTFDHGLTRNIGVENASGALVYLTVQDAWMGSDDMLERMAAHFNDKEVQAVVGHQAIPHEKDKNPFLWYRPYSAPEVTEKVVTDIDEFNNLPTDKQQSLVAWDDVVAMYRKSALMQQPFVQTEYAEDWIWSYNALQRGWKLLHDSSLVVYHYHHQNFSYVFTSVYTANFHFYKFFKYKPTLPSVLIPTIRSIYHLMKNKRLSFNEKMYWSFHNWSGRVATFFSTLDFLTRLKAGGEKGIEKGYSKYCKAIPQGRLK